MKKTNLIYVMCFSVLLTCCSIRNDGNNTDDSSNNIGKSNINNNLQTVVSSETAKFIAEGFSCYDYDLTKYNPIVEDSSEELWEVKFIGKEKQPKGSCCGGYDFSVFVSKKNGEITRATIGK